MMMKNYLSWRKIWNILEGVEFNGEDSQLAMIELIHLIESAQGSISKKDGKIIFIERYRDYLAYKYSSSIVGADDPQFQIEKKEHFINAVVEEKFCVLWLLNRINSAFTLFPALYFDVFFDRHFYHDNVRFLINKYHLHNDKYYDIIQASEFEVKKKLLLITPVPALLEMLYNPR